MSELSEAIDRLDTAVRILIAGAWFAFALCVALAVALLVEVAR